METSVLVLNMPAWVTLVVWLFVVHVASLTSMERIVMYLMIRLLKQEIVKHYRLGMMFILRLVLMLVLMLKFFMMLTMLKIFVVIVVGVRGVEGVVDIVFVEVDGLDVVLMVKLVVQLVVHLMVD